MDSKGVTIERSGKVAIVKFDRNDALNALTLDLMHELTEVALSFNDDLETTAVVLSGGMNAFSAGIDLTDPKLLKTLRAPVDQRRHTLGIGPRMCRAWESMEQVTICAIEGHCIGGGLALAVCCDFRVVGRGVRLKVPELGMGLNMSWQSLPRITSLVGPARAKQLVILAQEIGAEEALNCGIAQELAEQGQALKSATAMAEKVAEMPPLPVKMTKQAVNAIAGALAHATSYMDIDQSILCQMGEEFRAHAGLFIAKSELSKKSK